jgi:hypothetical protein
MRFPGDHSVRQVADGSFKFLVGDRIIFRSHGRVATRQRGFARRHGSLTPLHFAVGNTIGVLRERSATNEQNARNNCL